MKILKPACTFLSSLTPKHVSVGIFVIAFLTRIAFIVISHPYRNLARFELERTAISLATTGVYGNPYAVPTGPTAHVSPGYTIILAAIFRLFGTSTLGEVVKELVATSVVSLQCALIPWVARVTGLSASAGVLAGLCCALLPLKTSTEIDGDWEAPYTALFLILVSAATTRLWKRSVLSTREALVNGVLWGFAILFVSALLPMFLVFLAVTLYFCHRAGLLQYTKFAALQLVVVLLCLTPWIIRNDRALGAPIATRSNFGLEMRISNNDLATPNERLNDLKGLYRLYHPLQSPEEALKVRQLGEVAYNKQALREAEDWIHSHPQRFLQLSLGRIRWFWFFSDPTSKIKTILLGSTVVLGFAGLIYVWRENIIAATVFTLVLLIYPLPNYLIHLGLRQRFPIDWLLTLLSVIAIVKWATRFRRPSQD